MLVSISVTWLLCFASFRATLVDLCNANKAQCGFRQALPVLGYLVPALGSLRSTHECLNFRLGSQIRWQGPVWALWHSPPQVPTWTAASSVVQIPQQTKQPPWHQSLHLNLHLLASLHSCTTFSPYSKVLQNTKSLFFSIIIIIIVFNLLFCRYDYANLI